jgi:hypothetical protein
MQGEISVGTEVFRLVANAEGQKQECFARPAKWIKQLPEVNLGKERPSF